MPMKEVVAIESLVCFSLYKDNIPNALSALLLHAEVERDFLYVICPQKDENE